MLSGVWTVQKKELIIFLSACRDQKLGPEGMSLARAELLAGSRNATTGHVVKLELGDLHKRNLVDTQMPRPLLQRMISTEVMQRIQNMGSIKNIGSFHGITKHISSVYHPTQ